MEEQPWQKKLLRQKFEPPFPQFQLHPFRPPSPYEKMALEQVSENQNNSKKFAITIHLVN